MKYALRRDTHPVIPKLYGDHLVEINSPYVIEFEKAKRQAELKAAEKTATQDQEKLKSN